MNRYRILWIDDQHEDLGAVKIEAEVLGIDLTCFKTAKEGIAELEASLEYWDGLILDAKGYNESEDETPDLKGMSRVIAKINELKTRRYIPLFVFTGQPDTKGEKGFDDIIHGAGLKAYSKTTDREALYADIKKEGDKLKETQLRHKYQKVFIDGIDEHLLIEILKILDTEDFLNKGVFNIVRQIFENTLTICVEVKLFDKPITKVTKGRDLLKESDSVPLHIKDLLTSFISSSQDGSHYEQLAKDVADGKHPYIVPATIYGLLAYLNWLDRYRNGEKTK